ncbi:YkgJ family cysteine cluster protein [Natrarchaeobius oligotrophus]|uniref:YkgJ family cysteine cluster protein n=1 Tax=Natrarchaeobius chitinivorans TaxID=1679083 RepID=A0A3N6MIW9_NATCH|nr:YkgJ family cysteine cluster protein [Natrarchaeobius chitinivorans]RQH03218.1 YkgJ family cysteine cluster protein [Natrarchaeobius chitinivorans]
MRSLEDDLELARSLEPSELADAIESIGFECTRCGACCTSHDGDPHTATVFPDEVRALLAADVDSPTDGSGNGPPEDDSSSGSTATVREWRDVARPMPYGLREIEDESEPDGGGIDSDDATSATRLEGETFEWALQTDACGDCVFYAEDEAGVGACLAHEDRPLICRTYPFSVVLGDDESTALGQPMGETVDEEGVVRAHECEGLGRDISREDAETLARTLKERAIRELEEAIAVRDGYQPVDPGSGEVVVHDSEGAKRIDGTVREK